MPLFYKGTNNLRCRHIVYEVGKVYSIPRKDVKMCESGFHFCSNFNHIDLFYFLHKPNTIVIEIKVNENDIIEEDYKKSVASKIEIVRIVPKEEYEKLSEGKYKFENNECRKTFIEKEYHWKKQADNKHHWVENDEKEYYWQSWEYDTNNNLIKFENSDKFCHQWEYDEQNRKIKSFNSNGYRETWEYPIHSMISNHRID